MMLGGRRAKLMKAVSQLKEADYSKEPELNDVYQRLLKGKKAFGEVLEKNIKAVMQISSLDLTMQHHTERIIDISRKVSDATEIIFGTAAGNADNRHEELTNTIIHVSEETDEVYKKIEAGQEELTVIKELFRQTIDASREMQKDMDKLFETISQMNGVIAGIEDISLQTNLLALNASIEAARAGQAGKGFAVVADEIRGLAEEAQKLTGSMGKFVDNIKSASQKSSQSASGTISAIETMTEKIGNVWALNNENQQHVSKVNDSVSSLAAVSEEISSSMAEMENQLKESTNFMRQVGGQLKQATEPVVEIEKILDESVRQMGVMADDAFFYLDAVEFSGYIKNAISAHQAWIGNLKKMVAQKSILPLQLDSSKCGFGHFYYALTPRVPEVMPIWEAMEEKHRKFHGYGAEVINALHNGDYMRAEKICHEAEVFSKELISDMERMIQIMSK